MARIEADRKANSVWMKVPYVPLLPSTPKAAAALAFADDAMDDYPLATDMFQLPTAMLPVLPLQTQTDFFTCPPCDMSQWDVTDDESDGDKLLNATPALDQHSHAASVPATVSSLRATAHNDDLFTLE